MRKVPYFTIAFVVAFAFAIMFYIQNLPPTLVIDGVTWTQVLYWDFRDGLYPNGWVRGNYSIIEGCDWRRVSVFPSTHS